MKFVCQILLYVMFASRIKYSFPCPSECKCFGFDGEWMVDCAKRNLNSVPKLPENATEVFLQGNTITALDGNSFSGLSQLKYLYLQENSINSVEGTTFKDSAATLISLTLHGNSISSLPEGIFANMSALKVLNLNENQLQSISATLLVDTVNLVQASFYDNLISNVDTNAFATLRNLRYLGLANNRLRSPPELSGSEYPDLYFIDVADNMLESLPKVPSTANQIYANGNAVKTLQAATFADANQLYELLLVGNQVETIENGAFAGAQNLGWIDLTANKISLVDDTMFSDLSVLEGLYLASNTKLDQISTNAFSSFSSTLRRLSLNNCSFTNLNPNPLNQLDNADLFLWLGDNPWHCDCAFKDFANYVIDMGPAVYDLNAVQCESPSDLSGQKFSTVSFSYLCQNLALIIALPIVGAIVLFGIASFIFYKVQKKNKKLLMTESVPVEEYSNEYKEIQKQTNGVGGVDNKEMDSEYPNYATSL